MANKTKPRGDGRQFRRMRRTWEPRPIPAPTPVEIAGAAAEAWMYWAAIALGFVLIYFSFQMDGGPFDEFMFGLLTIVAAVAGARKVYLGARERARDRTYAGTE